MKLNRTGSNWTELERNKINENWRIIEGNYNDVVDKVSEEAFDKVVNSAKLNWKEPVDKYADLPSGASEGDTRMIRDSGKVYRFNGKVWQEIQQIDAGPVNELDARLTTQLAETINYSTNISNITDAGRAKEPLFTFIADDAPKNDLDLFVPIMQEKNIPFGIGVVTDWVGKTLYRFNTTAEFMDWEDLKYLETIGGEILGHSHTHPDLTSISNEDVINEITTCKKTLNEKGFLADGFIYPHNRFGTHVIRTMKKNFRYSFTGSGDNQPRIRNGFIRRTAFGSFGDPPRDGYPQDTLSYEYYKARVDNAFDNDDWLIFTIHTGNPSFLDATQRQYLRDIIDYIKSRGGKIVSPRNGFKQFGNILETGVYNTYIASDGTNNISSVEVTGINEKSAKDPITNFERGKVTITPTTQQFASNNIDYYPRHAAGLLKTYHFAESTTGLNYRTYECTVVYYGTNVTTEEYIQHWRNGEWSSWKIQSPSVFNNVLRIETANEIDVSDGNFVLFNVLGSDLEVNSIVGGAVGQEIIIMSVLNPQITIKHVPGTANNSINLKGREDRVLRRLETIRLINVNGFWVEV